MAVNPVEVAFPYSKQTKGRLAGWCEILRSLDKRNISGDIVECGVYQGASIICARMISPERQCWLYDTFAGMTAPTEFDISRKGNKASEKFATKTEPWLAASVSDVVEILTRIGVYDPRKIIFVEGDVANSLTDPGFMKPEKIAALRLDTDWYESTKVELEVLFPLLVTGGALVIDDYGYWLGARKAVDEYFQQSVSWIKLDDTAVFMLKS